MNNMSTYKQGTRYQLLFVLIINAMLVTCAFVINTQGQDNTEITPIRAVSPVYPDIARSVGIQGTVVVKVAVDALGNVKTTTKTTGDKILYNAAAVAAHKWVFPPIDSSSERSIDLHFTFLLINKFESSSDLAPVFLLPNTIEIRSELQSAKDSPNIDPKLRRIKRDHLR